MGVYAMKRIIACASAAVCLYVSAAYPSSLKIFQGLVIDVGSSTVEIKRGRREMTFFWDEKSTVLRRGAASDRVSVDICQKVRVRYAYRDGRPVVVTLEILSEGYCRK